MTATSPQEAAKRDAINARKVAALAFYRKREATQRQGGAA